MWGTLPAKNILERPDESIVIASDDSSETQSFELFVSSWNVGGIEPPDDFDMGDLLNIHKNTADIYVLGFQEIVPLNAGSIIASENSSVSYKWNSLIRSALNKRASSTITIQKAEAGECQKVCPLHRDAYFNSAAAAFECIASKQMVGVFVTIWARTQIHHYINHIDVSCVGCGIFGRIGNKGSVSVRFRLHETTFCFVCSHLASGGNKGDEKHRNTDATQILSRTRFPSRPSQALPRKIVDHDRVIWLGDLNYRIYLPEATTRSLVNDGQWSILLQNDQATSSKGGMRKKSSLHQPTSIIQTQKITMIVIRRDTVKSAELQLGKKGLEMSQGIEVLIYDTNQAGKENNHSSGRIGV
nr:type IV inositol polyphosphate 5-phosphatase 9-like isoform X1 [Ipomoea batatas]